MGAAPGCGCGTHTSRSRAPKMKLPILRDDGVAGGSSMMPKSQRERLRTTPTIGDSSIEDDHPQRRWCSSALSPSSSSIEP